jgi:hypothetical protein
VGVAGFINSTGANYVLSIGRVFMSGIRFEVSISDERAQVVLRYWQPDYNGQQWRSMWDYKSPLRRPSNWIISDDSTKSNVVLFEGVSQFDAMHKVEIHLSSFTYSDVGISGPAVRGLGVHRR